MSLKRGSVLGLLVLCLVRVGSGDAQAQGNSGENRGNRYGTTQTVDGDGGGLSALRSQMAVMQAQLDQALAKIALLQAALNSEVSAREAGDAVLQTTIAGLTPGVSLETLNAAIAVEAGARATADASLEGQIANEVAARAAADATFAPLSSVTPLTALVPLASYVTVASGDINGLAGPHVIFSGANVHIRSGHFSGDSLEQNGKGNLIVGYNESGYSPAERGGSHTVVVGPYHRYNFGVGLVAGYNNRLGGDGATIGGGFSNNAGGEFSTVSAGSNNNATNLLASVGGGDSNTASGSNAVVAAGQSNQATGDLSSVLGGTSNTASGLFSTVGGGSSVTNSDPFTFVP
jgi:hypothetical protein